SAGPYPIKIKIMIFMVPSPGSTTAATNSYFAQTDPSSMIFLHGIFWVFHLFADCLEKAPDPDLTHAIGDERRNEAAGIGINGIGGPGFVCAIRLQQPPAVAHFYPDNAFLFRRTEFIRRRPLTEIDQTTRGRPRFIPDAQRVIAV